jgi:signal transduction histidine kinase
MMTCAGGGALLLLFGLAVELLDLRRKAMVPLIGLFVGGVCYAAWSFQRSVRVRVADLEAARRGAVEAALSKAQFLANMSHEIRTPMNGILGMAELLARTTLDTEQLQMATTIRSSAESLLAVLNDVLDYSKIEAGKVDLEAADFDLWQVVDDCALRVGIPDRAARRVQHHRRGLPGFRLDLGLGQCRRWRERHRWARARR